LIHTTQFTHKSFTVVVAAGHSLGRQQFLFSERNPQQRVHSIRAGRGLREREPRQRRQSSGMLPISPIGFGESADFPLTGSGKAYATCGSFYTVGCLNVENHHGFTLDGVNMNGKAYLEKHKMSCHRLACPVCCDDAVSREVERAVPRFEAFHLKGRNLKPIHVVVSVPEVDYGLSLPGMRKKAYRALKLAHCIGGMMIYHSRRRNDLQGWYYSPHFHVVGYGWIDPRKMYATMGYVVVNLGLRKSLAGTIKYELSHAGISEKYHTSTWFGCLSRSKLHVEYKEPEPKGCPCCGEKLQQVIWVGEGSSPIPDLLDVRFFDDPDNWMIKPKRFYGQE